MTDRHFAANNKKNNVLNCFLAAALAGCEPFFQMSIYPPAKIKRKVTKPKITSAKKFQRLPEQFSETFFIIEFEKVFLSPFL